MKWPSRRFWILFLPICVGIILVRLYYSGDEGINEVAPITYPKVKTVLLIPGIISQEWMWGDWKKEMTALFPDAKVQMHQKFYYCVPTRPVQDFVTEIEQAVEITEEPVFILVQHRQGGCCDVSKCRILDIPGHYRIAWLVSHIEVLEVTA